MPSTHDRKQAPKHGPKKPSKNDQKNDQKVTSSKKGEIAKKRYSVSERSGQSKRHDGRRPKEAVAILGVEAKCLPNCLSKIQKNPSKNDLTNQASLSPSLSLSTSASIMVVISVRITNKTGVLNLNYCGCTKFQYGNSSILLSPSVFESSRCAEFNMVSRSESQKWP